MDVGLLSGLANALTFANIGFALIGCLLGTLVGILPGLGPASAMAILLPVALYLPADGAIIIMAGIYYGTMYGGSTTAILMNMLKQTPGVFPVMARDGWPKNPEKTFEGAKAVVFYMDGGGGHPIIQKDHREVVQKLMDKGVGFVNLHYAVEYPKKENDHVLSWLGGYYETGFDQIIDYMLCDHSRLIDLVCPYNLKLERFESGLDDRTKK